MGAVFGQRYGWERANWFAPPGVDPKDQWSFRRSNYFQHVGAEALRMRRDVGVIDLSPFTKHEVTGAGRRGLARRPGREQGSDQDRPNRALPCADTPRRHPLGIHDHQDRR